MSGPVIPEDSIVIVTVFRPTAQSRGMGTTRFIAQSPIGVTALADALKEKLPSLFVDAALPDLLLPGAPLVMMLQALLPDGQLLASSSTASLNRAAQRAEMLDAWKRDVPDIVGRFTTIVAQAVAPVGASFAHVEVAH